LSTLRGLNDLGQSVWLQGLRRDFLMDGSFAALIDRDGVSGLSSNPAIFARALDESTLYHADIDKSARAGDDAAQTYERLIVDDIRRAADMLEPAYYTS
jgi:transaldolase